MTLAAVFTPGSAFTFAASAHARKGFGYTFAFAAFIYTCEGSGSFSFLSSRLAGLMSIFSTVFWMLAILSFSVQEMDLVSLMERIKSAVVMVVLPSMKARSMVEVQIF